MHAVVFRVTLKDREKAVQALKERIVPSAKEAPGFVSGVWVSSSDGQGTATVVFESEDAAKQWSEDGEPPPAEIVDVNSVEIGAVDAQA